MTALRGAFLALFVMVLAPAALAKAVGTVKSVSGNTIVVTTDAGADVTVTLTASTRILRAAPGQTDLNSAPPIQVSDIKIGDRVLALGPANEGNSTLASTIVVMKQTDVANKQQQEREEWRKGVGGIAKEVSAAAGTVTVINALASGAKTIVIHVSPTTLIRRYSPDSVKFDDAKPGTLDEIKSGDQLRARGDKNADGTQFTAQAIVSGTFRQIAGIVVSTDAANASVTVIDLVAKQPVTLKLSTDSQLHKLPPFVAQRLATRLKGSSAAGPTDAAGGESAQGGGNRAQADVQSGQHNWGDKSSPGVSSAVGGGNWRNGGGSPDFQQMLARMPALSISDLQKGDAVMLVATEGSANSSPSVITLLSGVEPILTAVPSNAAAATTILSPWNLGASPGGGDAAAQ